MPRLTFLGTGTSVGVPMLACDCETCRSSDPRDQRYRCSVMVEEGPTRIVVDTPPEFRLQALRAQIDRLYAVFLTHDHADHVAGLDDLRAFTMRGAPPIPVYGDERTCASIRRRFDYIWIPSDLGTNLPKIELQEQTDELQVGDLTVTPLTVFHGPVPIRAYRFGSLAYVTDLSNMPDETREALRGLDTLVLEGLRPQPHPTHLHLEQSLALIDELKPRRTFLTHMCHSILHERDNAQLPDGVEFAYDGLVLDIP